MEEAWKIFKTEDLESDHLKLAPKIPENWENIQLLEKWEKIKKIRRIVNSAIEKARNEKKIGTSLEADVIIEANGEKAELIENNQMNKICMVARIIVKKKKDPAPKEFISHIKATTDKIEVWVNKTSFLKCLRCWQYKEDVDKKTQLCNRCTKVVN